MNRAVIYARFSSTKQREESIEGQIRECTAFADYRGFKIVGTYVDRAISGRSDHRPDFKRMIADSGRNKFDYVLVYQLDRFARNRYDSAVYKNKLKKNGVRVLSARENITDDASGIILESVLEGMAEYYSVELAQKVRRGMTDSALACKALGRLPLGYKKDADGHILLNEQEIPIVKMIFDRYIKNDKILDIIAAANEKRYLTSEGKPFTRNSLQRMVNNEIYIGTYRWNDIVKPGALPAIITPEIFAMAQLRNRRQKRGNKVFVKSNNYILTTKLKCGRCGGNMVGISGTSQTGATHYYYVCNNKRHYKNCDMRNIPQDKIEKAVLDATVHLLESPENVEKIAAAAIASAKNDNIELKLLQAQRRETQEKLNNCMKALDSGLVSDALMKHIAEHEAALKIIDEDIEKIKAAKKAADDIKKRVIFFLQNAFKGNENERKDYIISTLIHDIVLDYHEDTKQFFATVRYNYNELGMQTASGSTGNNPLHSVLVGPVGFEPTTNRL